MKQRLHKVMAAAGVASRRQCEKLIAQGRVVVNGEVVSRMGVLIEPQHDHIRVDGQRLQIRKGGHHYFVLHKPRNVVTTMNDPEGRPAVSDYLPARTKGQRLFPVGRLDYDVSGCLLLTNDGNLAHRLMHPSGEVKRVYRVKVQGKPSQRALARLKRRVRRCDIRFLRAVDKASWWQLTLYEGKYHQVKRLWQAVGHPVEKLSRVAFGGVTVRGLASGKLRQLTPEEIAKLRGAVKATGRKQR